MESKEEILTKWLNQCFEPQPFILHYDTIGKICEAMEEYRSQENHAWVPTSERLPENSEVVLIYWEHSYGRLITSGSYHDEGEMKYWQHGNWTQLKVSHWMYLPKPPKTT